LGEHAATRSVDAIAVGKPAAGGGFQRQVRAIVAEPKRKTMVRRSWGSYRWYFKMSPFYVKASTPSSNSADALGHFAGFKILPANFASAERENERRAYPTSLLQLAPGKADKGVDDYN
jgi:hypothetical protein